MKLLSLHLRNFKGVADSRLCFNPDGITLIHGPNEAGKSSHAEALSLVFNHKASANTPVTRDIRPVHRDANPQISLEAQSGPYHFIYHKEFKPRSGSTTLEILAPQRENLTGDKAHEKVNAILEETLDKPLWDALILRQGDMIRLPDLQGRSALMSALDQAAGGAAFDEQAETLYEKVAAAYGAYYTRDDREGERLAAADKRCLEAKERADAFCARLGEMQKRVERADYLKRRLTALSLNIRQAESDLAEQRRRAGLVEAAKDNLRRLELEQQAAESRAEAAGRARKEREEHLGETAGLRERLQAAHREEEDLSAGERGGERRIEAARQAWEAAKQNEAAAAAHRDRSRRDFDHGNNCLHLAMLRERSERIEAARNDLARAERELADNPVTGERLREIEAADLELTKLSARLDAASPRVWVKGLAAAAFRAGNEEIPLTPGSERTFTVPEGLTLTFPGLAEVRVAAGGGQEELRRQHGAVAERLAGLLAEAGAEDVKAAFRRGEARRRAEEALREKRGVIEENLRDIGEEDFYARLARLQREVAEFPGEGTPDLDAAEIEKAHWETAHAEALSALRRTEAAYHEEAKGGAALAAGRREAAVRRELLAKSVELAEARLAAERAGGGDDEVVARSEAAAETLAAAAADLRAGREAFEALEPEKVKALVRSLAGSLETLGREVGGMERELAELSAELRVREEEGLFEAAQAAQQELAETESRRQRLRQEARAAGLLYRVMEEERNRARGEYAAPLREKVEELGKWVFNPSFRVELDGESLAIRSRSLDGVTVRFENLSGGTREQLSLIFRAACAILVSGEKGMPLIVDDALGYCDAERLRIMGAVLAKAAEECQIIIFTCMPERYSQIGAAEVIHL